RLADEPFLLCAAGRTRRRALTGERAASAASRIAVSSSAGRRAEVASSSTPLNGSKDPLLRSRIVAPMRKERNRSNACSKAALLFYHRRPSVLRTCAGRRDLKLDCSFPSQPSTPVSAVIPAEYSTYV